MNLLKYLEEREMTAPKKTVCLVMIVKNEAHVILDTLRQLLTFIPFDTWSICDTGSTDNTKELIATFFESRGIPGQIHDTEWRDFGYNRTLAFELGRAAADYAFVWDADDSIEGAFVFPKELSADWYKFMFGNRSGFRYSRCQLFNNRFQWKYVGVLHEYPACATACASPVEVTGDYYFVSGRTGARNKNPMKYHDDARILEAAYKKAVEEKDPIHCRYAFYCAQSYASANVHEKAIEYYKIVLTLPSWAQEKYMSCLNIYNHLTVLGKEIEGFYYLVESFKYDRTRAECIYRLVKYYSINGLPEVALSYYLLLQPYFENQYLTETGRERLFANMDEYEFYLPYYMVIVGDRTKRYDIAAKMYEIIFTKKFTGVTKWWIDNLFTNMQFCMHAFPKTTAFLKLLFDYVDELRRKSLYLSPSHNAILTKFIDTCGPMLCQKPAQLPLSLSNANPRVMLTMTTCKRLDLFLKTVYSILNVWTDVGSVDQFFCVDDNSSEEDRLVMRLTFPFFEYYMKTPQERGHKESMNIIWERLKSVKPTYWIHLEDDWMFFHPGSFVERGIAALETHASKAVRQIVFNRNYGVVYNDLERTGGFAQTDKTILHELNPNLPGRHSGYWPHYSLQPSITKTETVLQLGNYTTIHRFFERGYADKYAAAGFKTAFFDSVHSVHIGKQHWEAEGKNAYALNEVGQFAQIPLVPNEPLTGTMGDHLDQIIAKIRAKRPFGLIRPSDGEHTVLLNRTLTNCDAWTFQAGGVLRDQLAQSIRIVDPNLYIGIPCNTCKKPWNCTEEIYTNYTKRWGVNSGQITFANIFMNSNWAKWTEFLKSWTAGLYLIGSGDLQAKDIVIKGRHIIEATLVNRWDSAHAAETESLYKFIDGLRGELVCFAAGPLSKVWIPLCMKRNPSNMYVDVGASLDIFTKGATNRSYTDPVHPFAKETCVFRYPTKPNLLYFCIFFNRDYCRLAKLLLTSLRLFSPMDAFDIVVMTTEEFRAELEGIAKELAINLRLHTLPLKTPFEAACARLKIFEYRDIAAYKTILYIDTDILIKGDLTPLFALATEDRIYGIESGTIASPSFGNQFFKGWLDFSKKGFNSGTLLFPNSQTMRDLFARIWAHTVEHAEAPPYCMDQPFINYHAIKDDLYNNTTLNPFVSLYEDMDIPTNEATSVLSHFSFPIGNAGHKRGRMTKYFLENLLAAKVGTSAPRVSGKTYNWGSSGKIVFTETGLETTWGNGTYAALGPNQVKASWNGYEHYLMFDGDDYVAVRTKPDDYATTFGSLVSRVGSRIYIHGDSHAMLLFKDFDVPNENLFEYGTTMHRIGRDGLIPKHRASHMSKDSTFVFVYGEVDCRAHIKRQVEAGRSVDEVCETLVSAYFKTIQSVIISYKAIIVVGVPPPVDAADHTHRHDLPFLGSIEERVLYTRVLNSHIEDACLSAGFTFFAPFENYTRADGCLKYDLSDGCIHIGKNGEFQQAFREVIRSPAVPLILHTCDLYEPYWNHWYFFFKKYVTGISKVYFLTEEKSPVFADEVTVIRTGKGEWGQRLLVGLEQISEPFVYYMQEDFWASKPFNPGQYVPLFFEKEMDALRITEKSPLYDLEEVSSSFYRFKQNSDYLMTHQFSLWNREYLSKWIRAADSPWTNEVERTKEIAKTSHAIYLVDQNWYEPVVRRNKLQPNGVEIISRHREEIAKSFVENSWYSNFLLKIRQHLSTDPIESFASWKILEYTMFTVANAAERAAIGHLGELPESLLERNKLHHRFLWKRFREIWTPEVNAIFEFGGGYGQLRTVVHEESPATSYAIYDFPELHAIQRHHLGEITTTFYTGSDELPKGIGGAFVAFWSYTECPKEVRDGLVPFLKDAAFDVLFFGLAQTFQLDNMKYLRELGAKIGYSVEFVPIDEMKSHDGQQYFCILRR
jgi:glycosyltransferase involved in cell wall biosynthesis